MRKIVLDDVLDIAQYERVRDGFRASAMEAKALRRVAVGPLVTVLFENFETMHYQLQEMMRAERMVRDQAIRDEMKTWNELVPGENELSLTLMVEETDQARARERLHELRDLEPTVSLRIGALRVPAAFESGWKDENRISAVQFIRFRLDAAARAAFDREDDVRLAIDHERYRHEARLPLATLAALRRDLAS